MAIFVDLNFREGSYCSSGRIDYRWNHWTLTIWRIIIWGEVERGWRCSFARRHDISVRHVQRAYIPRHKR